MYFIFRTLYNGCRGVKCRNFHASSLMRNDSFAKFKFSTNDFYKYGLLLDDTRSEMYSDVEEAIKRLPEEVQMQRLYRAIRAAHAEVNHSYLPKNQWTKFEDNHDYLQPYLKEIHKEREEMEEWEANH